MAVSTSTNGVFKTIAGTESEVLGELAGNHLPDQVVAMAYNGSNLTVLVHV